MHVLFSVLAPISLKNFDSVVREVARRGHDVTIVLHRATHAPGTEELLSGLESDCSTVTVELAPELEPDRWLELAADVRSSLDLLNFLDVRFSKTYRKRSFKRAARPVRKLAQYKWSRRRKVRALATRIFTTIHSALPTSQTITAYLRDRNPDLLLLTPYVSLRTIQPDYLRAAQSVGLRTAVAVYSWDNLTSKSIIRPTPSRVIVWNEIQKREAIEIHRIPEDRVAVTGAQCFDDWFRWQARPRAEFCARAGIDPTKPYVLYTCFTPFKGTGSEVDFVLRWIEHLRSSTDPRVRDLGIVIRPHPKRNFVWDDVELDGDNIVLWPRHVTLPTGAETKADLFDSIHHSAAVVGLNTSVMIEAGILDRPVLTVLAKEHAQSQQKTLHFRYLVEVGGGLLQVAKSLEEHVDQLGNAIETGAGAAAERFVKEFVRPHGLDVDATALFADELERLAAEPAPPPRRPPLWSYLLRPALEPLARRSAQGATETRRSKLRRHGPTEPATDELPDDAQRMIR